MSTAILTNSNFKSTVAEKAKRYSFLYGVKFDSEENIRHFTNWVENELYNLVPDLPANKSTENCYNPSKKKTSRDDMSFFSSIIERVNLDSSNNPVTHEIVWQFGSEARAAISYRYHEKLNKLIEMSTEAYLNMSDVDLTNEESIDEFCDNLSALMRNYRDDVFA